MCNLLLLTSVGGKVFLVRIEFPSNIHILVISGSTAYAAGRWALRGLTNCTRADLHETKITVQEVVLGDVKSEYFSNNPGSIERVSIFLCIV